MNERSVTQLAGIISQEGVDHLPVFREFLEDNQNDWLILTIASHSIDKNYLATLWGALQENIKYESSEFKDYVEKNKQKLNDLFSRQ